MTSTCRKTIERTFHSFFKYVSCDEKFRFIVHIDVLNPRYLPDLMDFLKKTSESYGVDIIHKVNSNPSANYYEAHSRAVGYLFSCIESLHYFHLEDDWIFLKKIDLNPLIVLMKKYPYIDHIRFSKKNIPERSWLYHISDVVSEEFLIPNKEVIIDDITLVELPLWSFNPHLGRTSVVKHFTDLPIRENPEKYICHKYSHFAENGKIYMYGRIGDGASVRDIGRNRLRQKIRKLKYILKGGKYAEYIF
ncbi:MAG TPA: hypothetical protein ENG83_13865 [Nitrospirae bacterium]|nr:hypothetical protein BMS3Abin06_00442 [bacterium BMS3Abin06]HDH13262.1 hypothetical protein [Nitrospirota bacterium]HDZ01770.1 hypothetical protein [Nitrospirota bacterium]